MNGEQFVQLTVECHRVIDINMYACQSVVPGQVTGGPTAVEELARIREEASKGSSGETVRKCLWPYL